MFPVERLNPGQSCCRNYALANVAMLRPRSEGFPVSSFPYVSNLAIASVVHSDSCCQIQRWWQDVIPREGRLLSGMERDLLEQRSQDVYSIGE
jgi:hypothetical protein